MSDAEIPEADAQGVALSPEQAAERLDAGEAQLIDVREPHEVEWGWIEGAVHIRIEELPSRAGEIDRERAVVFHCQGGNRSQMAAEAFRASGYDAYHIAGGLKAWIERDLPAVIGKEIPGES